MRWAALALVVLLAIPGAAGLASGEAANAGEATQTVDVSRCGPPCGEINPRIMFSFTELSDEPVPMVDGESVTYQGRVTYWADIDDEGYTPRDPQQPIVVQFSFPRLPAWAQMSIEPQQIEIPVNTCAQCFKTGGDDATRPTAHWAYSQGINLTVTATGAPDVTPGYDYGKLQLFAKSTESGIYNPGYGIREVRVTPDGGDIAPSSTGDANGAPGPTALAAAGVLASVALAVRLRRR